jgi:pimeloyl-ACP methyl ester carboxylesterase
VTVRFRVAEGVELAADVEGHWAGTPVLLLHGGGQTRHAWKGTGAVLADAGFLSVAVDLRGHGESDWAADGDYSLDAYAADVAAVAAALDRPAALVGASLGGLSSLLALGETPDLGCEALVLVDVTPADERRRPRADRRVHAGQPRRLRIGRGGRRRGVPLPPPPAPPRRLSGLTKNLRQQEDGRFYWHWDPRFLDAGIGHSVAESRERLDRAAARASVPLLLVRGTESEIVSEQDAAAFRAVAPQAEHVEVPRARHMVAGDRNDLFTRTVVEFLTRHLGS